MAPNWGANQGSSTGDYCNPGNLVGQLAAVWVIQYVPDAGPTKNTKPGDKTDGIQVDVVKLEPNNPAASTIHRTQLWRGGRFIAALKPFIGSADPCLVTFYEETPGNMATRRIRFVGDCEDAVTVAGSWYTSLGEAGFQPSQAVPYVVARPAQQQYASPYSGWPQGAVPAAQYQQQQAGWGQQQPPMPPQQPQQGQWGAPQLPQQQGGWGQQQPQQPPQGQWGAPQQQQGGWGQQQAPAQPPQSQWGAPQQQAQPPQQPQWGAPPAQGGWGQQQAQPQQQWGPPPGAAPQQAPPQQQQGSVMEMLANGQPQGMPDQGQPPF